MSEPVKKMRPWVSAMVTIVCIGILFVIALPCFVKSEKNTPIWKANRCINGLRQIDAAAIQFALEHHLTNGAPINFPNDLTPYFIEHGKIQPCPSGGVYHISKVGETPTCSLGTTVTPAHVLQ